MDGAAGGAHSEIAVAASLSNALFALAQGCRCNLASRQVLFDDGRLQLYMCHEVLLPRALAFLRRYAAAAATDGSAGAARATQQAPAAALGPAAAALVSAASRSEAGTVLENISTILASHARHMLRGDDAQHVTGVLALAQLRSVLGLSYTYSRRMHDRHELQDADVVRHLQQPAMLPEAPLVSIGQHFRSCEQRRRQRPSYGVPAGLHVQFEHAVGTRDRPDDLRANARFRRMAQRQSTLAACMRQMLSAAADGGAPAAQVDHAACLRTLLHPYEWHAVCWRDARQHAPAADGAQADRAASEPAMRNGASATFAAVAVYARQMSDL